MSIRNKGNTIQFTMAASNDALAAESNPQYRVFYASSGTIATLSTTADKRLPMFLQSTYEDGKTGDFAVVVGTNTYAVANAAFSAGTKLMCSSYGKLVTCTTGLPIAAIAVEAALADGDIVEVTIAGGQLSS